MRQFKALLIGAAGTVAKMDGIEHEGKLWLVPHWLDTAAEGVTRPARLVRFDMLPHQHTPNSAYQADYVINYLIPKELFEIQTPRQAIPGFEFVEMPEIAFPLADKKMN
jgi:hypothetical protein